MARRLPCASAWLSPLFAVLVYQARASLLGYYAHRFVEAARKLSDTADAARLWPWSTYPFEQPNFEAWVAKRYPDWLAFHREIGASRRDTSQR